MSGRDRQLAGQTLLVIGGSSGIGLETARRAHEEGAKVIITARDPERVQRAGLEVEGSIAAFDATDFHRLGRFFDELRTPIDHVLVTGPGPHDVPLNDFDVDQARRDLEAHLVAADAGRSRGREHGPPGWNAALHRVHRWSPCDRRTSRSSQRSRLHSPRWRRASRPSSHPSA